MTLSGSWLFASLVVGSVGFALALYGRKQARMPQLIAGIALVIDSAAVPSVGWMIAGAGLVLGALVAAVRLEA